MTIRKEDMREHRIKQRDQLFRDWQKAMQKRDLKRAKDIAEAHYKITEELEHGQRNSV